jgi:YD repeat-containing protein
MNSNLLDEYCEMEMGHTDWSMDWDEAGNLIVTFRKEAGVEYLANKIDSITDTGVISHA